MEKYEVGGCVRDEIMGIKSKDIDFSVVLSPEDMEFVEAQTVLTPYQFMVGQLESEGIRIIRNEKTGEIVGSEHLTVRGIHPTRGAVDYVLARREYDYSDGRRPDRVEIGTLMDDLRRRDFTMNAIAKDEAGNFIDPFDGRQDINECVIRAVGSARERLAEDALRALRALRFSITKGFRIDRELEIAMQSPVVLNRVVENIADERKEVELSKMFRFNTVESLMALNRYPLLTAAVFSGRVSLDATLKEKGRGHV